jgi:hypothetical protein
MSSFLKVAKKLSATMLSQNDAGRPTLCTSPDFRRAVPNAIDVYWADSSGRRNASIRRCRDGTATWVGHRPNRTACNAIAWPSAGGEA